MKKQIISGLLAACMAVSCLAVPTNNLTSGVISSDVVASAKTYTSGDYTYTVSNGKATITGYTGSATNLTIPSEIDGYTVTKIGNFGESTTIKKVTIPDTVKTIGDYSFSHSSLTSITIPSSVTKIGDGAFASCSSLASVTIPSSITKIGDDAFSYCSSLKKITVDSDNAKYSSSKGILYNKKKTKLICCPQGTKLTSLTLPDTVKVIEESAFSSCKSLKKVKLPETLKTIKWSAFYMCTSLETINLPDSLTTLEANVFCGCSSLKSIKIPSLIEVIGPNTFDGCTSLKSVTIPNSVTTIQGGAFYDCTSLRSVTIPESVTYIEKVAFGYKGNIDEGAIIMKSFIIKGYSGSAAKTYAKENGIVFKNVSTKNYVVPTVTKKSYTSSKTAVKIKWKTVSGATGYRIYRYNSSTKKWEKIKTIKSGTTTYYKDTGLKAGTTYKYKVKAYKKANSKTYWGKASSTIKTKTKIQSTKFTSTSSSTSAIRLNWKEVSGASGYQIQYSIAGEEHYESRWDGTKTIKSGSTTTYRKEVSEKGTLITFRIRAYKTVNGTKYYSAWSEEKSVRTKS